MAKGAHNNGQRPGARRAHTLAFYNELVNAYAKEPENHNQVSRMVGCAYATAKKAWDQGISGIGGPIRDVVFGLQAPTRGLLLEGRRDEVMASIVPEGLFARMEREAEEAQDADLYSTKMIEAEHTAKKRVEQLLRDAKVDAAETMAKEARLSRSARECAESIYDLAERIFTSGNVETLAKLVISAMSGEDGLKPSEAAKFLQTLASFGKEANTVAKLALELERLRVGKPTEIVKVEIENLTEVDALAIIEDAAAAAALLRDEEKPEVDKLN